MPESTDTASHTDGQAPTGQARLRISLPALLQDWRGAHARLRRYVAALIGPEAAQSTADQAVASAAGGEAWPPGQDAYGAGFARLRSQLGGGDGQAGERFRRWRLAAGLGGRQPPAGSAPPLRRSRMVPNRLRRHGLRRRIDSADGKPPPREIHRRRQHLPWTRASAWRRRVLALLVLLPTLIASQYLAEVFPPQITGWLEVAIIGFFAALFAWISIGFWTAMAGSLLLLFGRDRFAVTQLSGQKPGALDASARTAVIMPICEEPVGRVFAGLRSMYDSLRQTGQLEHFDFYVLSDTADPDVAVREEEAWFDWCREVDGFDRIFYRRRKVRVHRKSGNVADFCRRYGQAYRYMITLDADSVMSGETMVHLVRMIQANRRVGLIQTVPTAIRARSLYARIQQFANRIYGPLFAAGLHYFQLGDAQYIGHNAIVRIRPFMRHCALPRLPGKPPLGGEILSHDFVESALMGRGGYSVWLAYDLEGSWEEFPPSLREDLKRDRRWCQGNLQHMRLVLVDGLFGTHRSLFLKGVFVYLSELLWFAFLALSTAVAILQTLAEPNYFPAGPSLFPEWPVWRPAWAIALLLTTITILFLPKLLALAAILLRPALTRQFGGGARLSLSVLLEILASTLFAPIRMLFHTKFVLTNLLGRTVSWDPQNREGAQTSWEEAVRNHGWATLLACGWGAGIWWLNPDYFWWLTPILVALFLSIPLAVLASRASLGDRARALGLFLTPEETTAHPQLAQLEQELGRYQQREATLPAIERQGFVRAVVDPRINALHAQLLRGPRRLRPDIRAARRELLEQALDGGPAVLSARQRRVLLQDPELLDELHWRVWQEPDPARAARWGRPGMAMLEDRTRPAPPVPRPYALPPQRRPDRPAILGGSLAPAALQQRRPGTSN